MNRKSLIKPYFSELLNSIKNKRNKFYKLKERFPNNDFFKTQFIYLKNLLKKTLISEKRKYTDTQVEAAKNNLKKLWKITNSLIKNDPNISTDEAIQLIILMGNF